MPFSILLGSCSPELITEDPFTCEGYDYTYSNQYGGARRDVGLKVTVSGNTFTYQTQGDEKTFGQMTETYKFGTYENPIKIRQKNFLGYFESRNQYRSRNFITIKLNEEDSLYNSGYRGEYLDMNTCILRLLD